MKNNAEAKHGYQIYILTLIVNRLYFCKIASMQIVFHSRFPVIICSNERKDFLTQLLICLADKTPNHRYIIIAPDFKLDIDPKPNNIEWIKRPSFSERARLLELTWKRIQLPRIIKKTNATLFMAAEGELINQLNIPQILFSPNYTLFETSHHKTKQRLSTISTRKKNDTVQRFLSLMPSNFHHEIFLKTTNHQIKNSSVLYPASSSSLKKIDKEAVKSKLTQDCEYFICDAVQHPKENILILLKAFSRFKKRLKSNMKLVISGRINGYNKKFQEELNAYRFINEVVICNVVDDLDELIAAAYAGIFFNQPNQNPQSIIDSLYVDVPTISTDHALNREITDDVGLFFQENNDADLAAQMMLIYKDEDLRSRLINAAQKRKNIFSMTEALRTMENILLTFAHNE